jgi:glucose-1-phosphate cytidylyltransferase
MSAGLTGIVLAGGLGQRMGGLGGTPKPLVEVRGAPLLLHVAGRLAHAGARRIIVLTGSSHGSVADGLGLTQDRGMLIAGGTDVAIELRFSGEGAGTGGRLSAISPDEIGPTALLSYTDIVCDADLRDLLALRKARGAAIALLAVNPVRPWGELSLAADAILAIEEKTLDPTRWINGGLFAITPEVWEHVASPSEMLEAAPLGRIVAKGAAVALRHRGAWAAVDTPKDVSYLDSLDDSTASALLPSPPTVLASVCENVTPIDQAQVS